MVFFSIVLLVAGYPLWINMVDLSWFVHSFLQQFTRKVPSRWWTWHQLGLATTSCQWHQLWPGNARHITFTFMLITGGWLWWHCCTHMVPLVESWNKTRIQREAHDLGLDTSLGTIWLVFVQYNWKGITSAQDLPAALPWSMGLSQLVTRRRRR